MFQFNDHFLSPLMYVAFVCIDANMYMFHLWRKRMNKIYIEPNKTNRVCTHLIFIFEIPFSHRCINLSFIFIFDLIYVHEMQQKTTCIQMASIFIQTNAHYVNMWNNMLISSCYFSSRFLKCFCFIVTNLYNKIFISFDSMFGCVYVLVNERYNMNINYSQWSQSLLLSICFSCIQTYISFYDQIQFT